MSKRLFTKVNPPIGGKSKKLWDWFTNAELFLKSGNGTKETIKAAGIKPDELFVIKPGHWQRAAGAAEFEIKYNYISFYCHNLEDTLKNNTGMVVYSMYSGGIEKQMINI